MQRIKMKSKHYYQVRNLTDSATTIKEVPLRESAFPTDDCTEEVHMLYKLATRQYKEATTQID